MALRKSQVELPPEVAAEESWGCLRIDTHRSPGGGGFQEGMDSEDLLTSQ